MVAGAQHLHNLHRQSYDRELPGLSFRDGKTKPELAASDNHVSHNMIDCVMVYARTPSNNFADLAPDVSQELSRARK